MSLSRLAMLAALADDDYLSIQPAFDPALLSLTGWWRAPYTGSPWVGIPSAGTSGSNPASHATLAPDVGVTLNGFAVADFEQANLDFFTTNTIATFMAANAGSVWALVNPESVRADQANVYEETNIFTGENSPMMVLSTSGMRASLHDGAFKVTARQALPVGTWALAQMRYNGTTLESRVNGGAWQTVPAGNTVTTGNLHIGRNAVLGGVGHYDGLMAEFGVTNTRLSDVQFDQIKSYINARYALSL